jgi:hypothetical protein
MSNSLKLLVAVCGTFWAASADGQMLQGQENNRPPQSSQRGPDIGPIQRRKEESAILPSAARHEQSAAPLCSETGGMCCP